MRSPLAASPESWFQAHERDGRVQAGGLPEAFFGHRIERPGEPTIGNWAEWRWDGERLEVRNDPFGVQPVFYWATPTRVMVSPSVDRLLRLGAPRDLDHDALAAFLGVGYYLDEDTPFRAIRALPRAGTLTWRPGEVSVTGAARPLAIGSVTRTAAMDGIIQTVRVAVRRSIPPDRPAYLMPLSGGRDSRHLLLELRAQGHPPRACVTARQYATLPGGPDARFAAKLCAALDLQHRALDVPGRMVAAELRKNRVTGYCSDEHTWSLSLAAALAGHTGHTYDGLPGGTLIQRPSERASARAALEAGRLHELAEMYLKTDTGQVRFVALLSPAMRARLSPERAAARVRVGLEAHLSSGDPLLAFRFWNRVVRELALVPTRVLSGVRTVFTPYMDPEFIDFAAALPPSIVGKELHSEALARAFPEAANVPYAHSGPQTVTPAFARQVSRDIAVLLLRTSDGSLVDRAALLRRAARGILTGDDWLARGRRPALVAYLVQLEALVRGEPAGVRTDAETLA
jgi:asparagine synthase (glutamine-hydrolysing)